MPVFKAIVKRVRKRVHPIGSTYTRYFTSEGRLKAAVVRHKLATQKAATASVEADAAINKILKTARYKGGTFSVDLPKGTLKDLGVAKVKQKLAERSVEKSLKDILDNSVTGINF